MISRGKRALVKFAVSIPIRIALTVTVSFAGTLAVGVKIGERIVTNRYAAPDSIAFYPAAPPGTVEVAVPPLIMVETLQEQRDQILFLQTLLLEKPDTVRIPEPYSVPSPPETLVEHHWFPAPPETVFTAPPFDDPWDDPWDWGFDPRRPGM
jgi:hypothetical protein